MEQQGLVGAARPKATERQDEAWLFKQIDDEYFEGLEADEDDGATEDLACIIAAARGDLGID